MANIPKSGLTKDIRIKLYKVNTKIYSSGREVVTETLESNDYVSQELLFNNTVGSVKLVNGTYYSWIIDANESNSERQVSLSCNYAKTPYSSSTLTYIQDGKPLINYSTYPIGIIVSLGSNYIESENNSIRIVLSFDDKCPKNERSAYTLLCVNENRETVHTENYSATDGVESGNTIIHEYDFVNNNFGITKVGTYTIKLANDSVRSNDIVVISEGTTNTYSTLPVKFEVTFDSTYLEDILNVGVNNKKYFNLEITYDSNCPVNERETVYVACEEISDFGFNVGPDSSGNVTTYKGVLYDTNIKNKGIYNYSLYTKDKSQKISGLTTNQINVTSNGKTPVFNIILNENTVSDFSYEGGEIVKIYYFVDIDGNQIIDGVNIHKRQNGINEVNATDSYMIPTENYGFVRKYYFTTGPNTTTEDLVSEFYCTYENYTSVNSLIITQGHSDTTQETEPKFNVYGFASISEPNSTYNVNKILNNGSCIISNVSSIFLRTEMSQVTNVPTTNTTYANYEKIGDYGIKLNFIVKGQGTADVLGYSKTNLIPDGKSESAFTFNISSRIDEDDTTFFLNGKINETVVVSNEAQRYSIKCAHLPFNYNIGSFQPLYAYYVNDDGSLKTIDNTSTIYETNNMCSSIKCEGVYDEEMEANSRVEFILNVDLNENTSNKYRHIWIAIGNTDFSYDICLLAIVQEPKS